MKIMKIWKKIIKCCCIFSWRLNYKSIRKDDIGMMICLILVVLGKEGEVIDECVVDG